MTRMPLSLFLAAVLLLAAGLGLLLLVLVAVRIAGRVERLEAGDGDEWHPESPERRAARLNDYE